MIYQPRVRRRGFIKLPFGYFVSPFDSMMLLPDPKVLDALHHAFRMKAKYNTPIRDCAQWIHMATGQRITHNGFMYKYKAWATKLRKEKRKELTAKKKALLDEQERIIQKEFKHLEVILDDNNDITALARKAAIEEEKANAKAKQRGR